MLEQEYKYFKDHQKELVKEYPGRYVVIVGEVVVGNYSTYVEAYQKASEEHELGTFLIQECTPGTRAYTSYVNSSLNHVAHP